MSLGSILSTAAPIAAGYFAPGAGTFLGNATANAVAAGALTGAGIAALSGGDILTSGVMGGLGGYSGGEMFGAFNPAAGVDASVKAGTTTAVANEAMLSPYTNLAPTVDAAGSGAGNLGMFSNAQAVNQGIAPTRGFASAIGPNTQTGLNSAIYTNPTPASMVPQGANIQSGTQLAKDAYTTGNASKVAGIRDAGSGGYAGNPAPLDRSFSAGIERLGGGDSVMGYGKLGLAGLPVVASAFEPETFTYDQMKEAEAYDPDATLNLDDPALDSGIEDVIDSDSGLRLYAKEGGIIPTYAEGGTIDSRAKEGLAGALARNKGIAYAPSTTAPSPTTTPSNINIAGSNTSNMNLTGGMGSLNVGTGTVGQSADAVAEAARAAAAKPKTPPMEFIMGRGMMPVGAIEAGPAANYSSNLSGTGYTFNGRQYGMPGYAEGGMLEGPGDGMSDSLAAQIDGSQPAALSQGEFVVPADVVSHLGNGSSDAGSKRLYAMMDEVRQARTGTEKQGKEINPERYMPA